MSMQNDADALRGAVAACAAYWKSLETLELALGGGSWSARANDKIVDLVNELATADPPAEITAAVVAELRHRSKL